VIFRRRKREEQAKGESTAVPPQGLGEPRGVFVLENVYVIAGKIFGWNMPPALLVIVGKVHTGDLRVGDVLRLPDGRLLKVKSIEAKRRKVESAAPGVPVGVAVEGVGWKPQPKDLKAYALPEKLLELKKKALSKYEGRMPREVAERLAEDEVRRALEAEIERLGLVIYRPSSR